MYHHVRWSCITALNQHQSRIAIVATSTFDLSQFSTLKPPSNHQAIPGTHEVDWFTWDALQLLSIGRRLINSNNNKPAMIRSGHVNSMGEGSTLSRSDSRFSCLFHHLRCWHVGWHWRAIGIFEGRYSGAEGSDEKTMQLSPAAWCFCMVVVVPRMQFLFKHWCLVPSVPLTAWGAKLSLNLRSLVLESLEGATI